MERHYFNPTRVSKYKWTFTAHGCQMYEDGTIEWDGSSGGYFAKDDETNEIDELRKKYPLRICRLGEPQYEAVLVGVQPLSDGEEFPMYRFPGGISCQDPFEPGIKIVEW